MIWSAAKYAGLVIFFFLAAVLQASFLPYISVLGATPNLVFILFFTVIFFEKKQAYVLGFFMALLAGFLLDIIMSQTFGVSIISLLVIYAVYKIVIHFLKESQGKNIIFYFIVMFSTTFWAYHTVIGAPTISGLAYSLVIAIIAFSISKKLLGKRTGDNQLKLL